MTEPLKQSDNKHGRDLTVGSIPRHLVMFSLPMLAGNAIQVAYSLVNGIWVGKFLGSTQLAAVTDSMPVMFLLMAIAIGLTIGTSILAAQFAGAREWDRFRQLVQTSTAIVLSASVILMVLGQFLSPWLMQLMHSPADVYPLAVSYLKISLFSIPFVFGLFLLSSMLRGVGDSKTPLYFQAGALVMTAIFDPILMFGWLGFPRMGLNGTAVASTVMQMLCLAVGLIYIRRKDHIAAPDWRRLSIHWPTGKLILKISIPSVLQQSLISLGMVAVMGFVNSFGKNAATAFGAAIRIDQVVFLPSMTFGVAISTLVGQNIGANRLHRAKETFLWGMLISGGTALVLSVFAITMPRLLVGLFVKGYDPQVVRLGVSYLRIVGFCYVFMAMMFVSNGVINGAGYTLITTLISLISLWVARVPLAAYLTSRMHKVEGVYYAIAISIVASAIISQLYYFTGKWKRPIIRHQPILDSPAAGDEPFCPSSAAE
ncbi:MAG: MATE family efflux transporter [Armatimonadota bacterium]